MTIFTNQPPNLLQKPVQRYYLDGTPTSNFIKYEKDLQTFLLGLAAQLTPWTAYAPNITAGSGTFTTVSATGRFMQIGKTTFVQIIVTETTIGTAATSVIATLPTASAKSAAVLAGSETATTNKMLQGRIAAAGTTASIVFYDGTAPITNGYVLNLSGVYEST